MGSTSDHAFNVYRGTFIQLSRLPAPGSKPELCRDQGALWVSTADGRIKGWDWQARDDQSFADLMTRSGWVDLDAAEPTDLNSRASRTGVKVITANEDNNEFFFPGFIGRSSESTKNPKRSRNLQTVRYTHSCPAIPKCRALRLFNSARLARNIHLPRRIRVRQSTRLKNRISNTNSTPRYTHPRTTHLQPSHRPHSFPRNNLRLLLRNNPHPRNKRPRSPLSRPRPARLDRQSMYGRTEVLSKILLRLIGAGLSSRKPRNNQFHTRPRSIRSTR